MLTRPSGSRQGTAGGAFAGVSARRSRRRSNASPADEAVRTSGWTAGRALATRAHSLLAWGAVCCGPIALAAHAVTPEPPPAVAVGGAQETALSPAQQAAGAHALGFVGAWLSATRDDPAGLDAYLGGATSVNSSPREYRELAVASIQPDAAGGGASVVVCGRVREETAAGEGTPPAGQWINRCFQVAVAVQGERMSVLGMPGQIGPPQAASSESGYRDLGDSPQIAQAVQLFLTAYLAGSPEVERFTAPESGIRAIQPGPYIAVAPRSLAAEQEPPAGNPEGASLRVLASVDAETVTGRVDAMSYWLTLRVRDGRWEIVSIDPGPVPASARAPEGRRASGHDSAPGHEPASEHERWRTS